MTARNSCDRRTILWTMNHCMAIRCSRDNRRFRRHTTGPSSFPGSGLTDSCAVQAACFVRHSSFRTNAAP
jgi:hypothetical protein